MEKTSNLVGDVFVANGNVTVLLSDGNIEERTNLDGFTLYTFAPDEPGTGISTCVDTCIDNWPPLLANADSVDAPPLTVVDRDDGNRQWALRDKPLYFFTNDSVPGDEAGHGVGDVWFAASGSPTALGTVTVEASDIESLVGGAGAVRVHNGTEALNQNKEGFALYTFVNDSPGQPSACDAACLANWPALIAEEGDVAEVPFSLIEHPVEGVGMQWAYRGMPLYFFANDAEPGVAVNNPNWPVARPIPMQGEAGTVLTAVGTTYRVTFAGGAEVISDNPVPADGLSLYIFDSDTEDQPSTCVSETCITNWNPLMAHAGAEPFGPFSLIERSAGGEQWALDGMPLYFFTHPENGDTAPGDTNGDGIGGVWHLARISPVAVNSGGNFVANGTEVDGGSGFAGQIVYFRTADTAEGTVTLQDLRDNVFTPNCSGCHGNSGGMTITGGAVTNEQVHAELLAPAEAAGATGDSVGLNRVEPGEPDNSYLIHKLQGEPGILGTPGGRMPAGGDPLDAGLIQMVRDWITFGAPLTGGGTAPACDANCLAAWPPLLAAEGAVAQGNFSIIENSAGQNQWAYNGQPLYFFAQDDTPDVGSGESAAWPIATP